MSAIIASILFVLVVFFSSASAEEINTVSLYLEQNGSFIWLNGDTSRINKLVQAFVAKSFVEKVEGQIEVVCIVDTFAVLNVGEDRGTAVTCGRGLSLNVRNNDPQYVEKVVEYVDWFIQYVRSPFTGEAEKNQISLRNDDERSCVFLQTTEFKKNKKGSQLYESQSRTRFLLLLQAMKESGYVEKQANWTLCNAAFANRRCVVSMDHMEGRQLIPVETQISCFTVDRTRISEGNVTNDLPVEEYAHSVLNAVQTKMNILLDDKVIREDTKSLK